MLDEYLIGGQVFEQCNGGVEEVDKFVLGLVVGVAAGAQRRVTSSVFAPLMFPGRIDQHVRG